MSNIEWTGDTWNPIVGCSRISDGCKNCYAETMTKRLAAMGLPKYQGLLSEQGRFNGETRFDEDALLRPLKRKKPTTYFVNSMSDLFHGSIPDEWIDKVFAVMALCPQHTMQILSKRPARMSEYFKSNPLPRIIALVYNVIYGQGTSITIERTLRDRIRREYLARCQATRKGSQNHSCQRPYTGQCLS